MNVYYITGTSRGIGKALAEGLLQNEDNLVIGLSRTNGITNEDYTHVELDLSDLAMVKAFRFGEHPGAKTITLINNAGMVGPIRYAGKINPDAIERIYNVNLTAPSILVNAFIEQYDKHHAQKQIINISSGAGKNPIDGWSVYCASKAGLDLFSRTVAEEFKLKGRSDFRIWSVAPGVVDTQMQEDIRSAGEEHFSRLASFVEYQTTNQLAHPEAVAKKYFRILESPSKFPDVVFSVKDIDNA